METQLNQVFVQTEADVLCVHEMALQLAAYGDMEPLQQIQFAVRVAEQCVPNGTNIIPCNFRFVVDQQEGGHYYLRILKDERPVAEMQVYTGDEVDLLKLPESFWKSRKQLEKSFRDMQQFTFAISHDLKNSLTKLRLALSLVSEEELPPTIHNYIQIIHRSATRLEKTMLSLNQVIELGHSSNHVVNSISPAEIFEDVRDEFSDALLKMRACIDTDFDGVAEFIYPEVYLKSILTNLLSNALKYFSPQRTLQLEVSATREGRHLHLHFVDNGQGIDLDRFGNRLFQPFTRFSSDTEGSGLGLYLIKYIVERNGGAIRVESRPGEGTRFHFILVEYDLPPGK